MQPVVARTGMPIWIEVSDMLVWSGHYTGIQRVTFEYARRFEKDGARFCAYDKLEDRFFELDIEYVKSLQQTNGGIKQNEINVPRTTRNKIRKTLGKPYYSLSEGKKTFLRPLVDMANFYVRHGISRFDSFNSKSKSPFHDKPTAEFGENETIILLGASWNDLAILNKLIDLKQKTRFRLIQHINDLLPIYQPQLFSEELPGLFRPYINKVIHHADVITVISNATKRDVEAYCKENNISEMPIHVVRLGEDVKTEKPLRPESVKTDESFLLAVGTFEVRKNYALLYQAMKLAQLEGRDIPKIVIVGRKGWLTDDLEHTLQLDPYTREHLLWLSNASDNELSWLYENCMFGLFPSLSEGWGLPITEALHHGKMVLASGVSSMLEIGDGHVDYFLPYDARECLEKIRYYVADDRYKIANSKVKKQYKGFTWDESFQQLKQAITN